VTRFEAGGAGDVRGSFRDKKRAGGVAAQKQVRMQRRKVREKLEALGRDLFKNEGKGGEEFASRDTRKVFPIGS